MKQIIKTQNAPLPIGPYNQAVIANNTLYISGQIAINPANGELVTTDIETETRQVMENLQAILTAAGLTFENVLKASVFVKNMHYFSRINAIYNQYFNEATAPARELVEVANLPRFVNIEISMIASIG
jgi:2-iminobutanoate/2-iminopropanoate deaminase